MFTQQCTGLKCPFIDLTCPLLVELCNKSQQEWHFEVYTLIRRKFGIVAIYALFCVKFWPQKCWSCKWFDKYHVCHGQAEDLEKRQFFSLWYLCCWNFSIYAEVSALLKNQHSCDEISAYRNRPKAPPTSPRAFIWYIDFGVPKLN